MFLQSLSKQHVAQQLPLIQCFSKHIVMLLADWLITSI